MLLPKWLGKRYCFHTIIYVLMLQGIYAERGRYLSVLVVFTCTKLEKKNDIRSRAPLSRIFCIVKL